MPPCRRHSLLDYGSSFWPLVAEVPKPNRGGMDSEYLRHGDEGHADFIGSLPRRIRVFGPSRPPRHAPQYRFSQRSEWLPRKAAGRSLRSLSRLSRPTCRCRPYPVFDHPNPRLACLGGRDRRRASPAGEAVWERGLRAEPGPAPSSRAAVPVLLAGQGLLQRGNPGPAR